MVLYKKWFQLLPKSWMKCVSVMIQINLFPRCEHLDESYLAVQFPLVLLNLSIVKNIFRIFLANFFWGGILRGERAEKAINLM